MAMNLGAVKYMVRYLKPCGQITETVMEVENNSMAVTNLVYAFYAFYPGCKIVSYTKI